MLQLLVALIGVVAIIVAREWVRRRVLRVRGQGLALLAGTSVSYVGAVAVAFAWGACIGVPRAYYYAVHEVKDGFDARGKLERGDILRAVDGFPLPGGVSLTERVHQVAPKPVVLTIERAGIGREVTVTPRQDGQRWLLGITQQLAWQRDHSVGSALARALRYPLPTFSPFGAWFSRESADPGGPKRIVEVFYPYPGFLDGVLAAMSLLARLALYAMIVADLARATLAMRRRRAG